MTNSSSVTADSSSILHKVWRILLGICLAWPANVIIVAIGIIIGYFVYSAHSTMQLEKQLDALATVALAGNASDQFETLHKQLIELTPDGYDGAEDQYDRVAKREEHLLAEGMAKGEAPAFDAVYSVSFTQDGHITEYNYQDLTVSGWPALAAVAARPAQSPVIYHLAADEYQKGSLTTRDSYRAIALYGQAWLDGDTTVAMPMALAYRSVGANQNAYLWSLRALPANPAWSDDIAGPRVDIEAAIPPAARPPIQALAGDPKILTVPGASTAAGR